MENLDDFAEKEDKEDSTVVKKIISRLSFIRSDLKVIEQLDIKSEEIRQIIEAMKKRVELLLKLLLSGGDLV